MVCNRKIKRMHTGLLVGHYRGNSKGGCICAYICILFKVKTINVQDLTAYIKDGKVTIEDASGGKAEVITADLKGSKGVIHVTNAVSLPK